MILCFIMGKWDICSTLQKYHIKEYFLNITRFHSEIVVVSAELCILSPSAYCVKYPIFDSYVYIRQCYPVFHVIDYSASRSENTTSDMNTTQN